MLWLLRHAEAEDGLPDDDRPLTERGAVHADAAGRTLAVLGVHLDACLSSPKLRAVQTAERACEPLGVPVTIERSLSGEPFDVHALTAGLGTPRSHAASVRTHGYLLPPSLPGDGRIVLVLRPADLP